MSEEKNASTVAKPFILIKDSKDNHIFSVEIGNIIKWTDAQGDLHTVKSNQDLDTAMGPFVAFIKKANSENFSNVQLHPTTPETRTAVQ